MKLRRLVLEGAAEAEIEDATAWYEQQSAQLALALIADLRSALERAVRQPNGSLAVPGIAPERGVRRLLLSTFPFALVFVERADVAHVHRSRASTEAEPLPFAEREVVVSRTHGVLGAGTDDVGQPLVHGSRFASAARRDSRSPPVLALSASSVDPHATTPPSALTNPRPRNQRERRLMVARIRDRAVHFGLGSDR